MTFHVGASRRSSSPCSGSRCSGFPLVPAPPTRRRTRSHRATPIRRSPTRRHLLRRAATTWSGWRRTVAAGGEAAGVPAHRGPDQPPVGIHRARDRGRSWAITRSSSLPQRGADRGVADRVPPGCGAAERCSRRTLRPSTRARRSSTGRTHRPWWKWIDANSIETVSTSCSCTSRTPSPRKAGRSFWTQAVREPNGLRP